MKSNLISFNEDDTQDMIIISGKKPESKAKVSPIKHRKCKDYDILMTLSDYQPDNLSNNNNSSLDYKNLLKSTCKDVRRVRDAVMVRSLPLYQKQNNQNRKKQGKQNNECLTITKLPKKQRKSLNSIAFHDIIIHEKSNTIKRPNLNIKSRQSFKKSEHSRNINILQNTCDNFHKNNSNSMVIAAGNKLQKYSLSKNRSIIPNDQIIQRQNTQSMFSKNKGKNQFDVFGTNRIHIQNKTQCLVNQKLTLYLNQVKKNALFYGITNFQTNKNISKRKSLRVHIKKGNNCQLVKWVFKKRWWWSVQDEKQSIKNRPNFLWSQLKDKTFFTYQNQYPQTIFSHNHFPSNQYLGNKKALLYNMKNYYKSCNKNVFNYLPLTYHIKNLNDQEWQQFIKTYNNNYNSKFDNTWIVKPGQNSNRGKGITVSNDLNEIKGLINSGLNEDPNHQRSFILQKYIDKPFLYNLRKFDIRAFILISKINNKIRGFWYQQGYVRTSSYQYQLDNFDTFVHLTNDAIQNHSQNYGKFQQGNKLSYVQFQKYLDKKYPHEGYQFNDQLIPKMKQIGIDCIKSSYRAIINGSNQCPIFQIYGLDYMIDAQFKPWLIEVNTNPCLQTTCNLLRKIIPKMLDDTFKLTLDIIYPPSQNWASSKKYTIPSLQSKFQLVFSEDYITHNIVSQDADYYLGNLSEDQQVYEQ